MEKHIITYFETTVPSASNNIAAGYNIGQHWFNSTDGVEYVHKSDGVWIGNDSYSNSGHTHSQYLTGYTETNPGVYTSGQTDTLLLGKSNTGHTHNYLPTSGGTLSGSLTGITFVKSSGTSDQYLMADGSVLTTGMTQSYYDGRYVNVSGDTINGNLFVSGTTSITGNTSVVGNVSGTTFYGSGSGLTNIPASGVTGLNLDRITSGGNSAIMTSTGLTINTGTTITGKLKIVDSMGNLIAEISDTTSDTLWDVLDTNNNIVFSVGNDGSFKQNSITVSGLTTGNTPYTLFTINKSSCDAIYYDYVLKNTLNNSMKSGTILCVHDGSTLTYTQYSTDYLNTDVIGITLTPQIVSTNVVLISTITSGNWVVKLGVRKI